ncbi:Serine/threonine-protein phosphatase 7 long form-like [Vitis vinifera]|uniref:Serine/threonine-protein phosphatase 7 long form-like n=1 Tax=Vitis vinifera TaxID=29760 RepID=A0A438GII0_VITVI|nr:Serine/threonine-protein phosphatase 7 long form-like [Vitis vinifera]
MRGPHCDMSNNPDPEDPIKFSLVQYNSAPSLQFENVENIGNVVSSDWTPWGNTNIGNSGGEFMLLVLRCKKAKQSQCPWKLRALVVKDSNLIAAHIQGMIKAQFTLSVAVIQASCDGNNQLFPLAFALTEGIMAAMSDVHLGWSEPYVYHRVCMRHLASNFMTRFKDKILKNMMCKVALATKIEKFNKHMNTIGRINAAHNNGWKQSLLRNERSLMTEVESMGIMTTNMSEVFYSVLKGARSLPITALVQLTFFRLNSYFVVRREQGANRLASNEEYTPYVDAKIKANVVKAGSHEIVLYDHIRGQFHVKTNKGTKSSSTRGRTYRINLQEYTCTYMEYRGHSSDPDPLDTSVLVLQDRHRSHLVDSGQLASVLTCRQHISRSDSPTSEIRGSAISTRWLCHQFSHPPVDLDDATLERYARAFILGLIETPRGSPDFGRPPAPPTAQHLEHDVADDLPAEQWRVPLSWAQNPSRVLTFYRDQLDAQTHDQVLWEPYMGDLVAHLPAISLADQEIWRTMSPLICFDISSGIDRSECCDSLAFNKGYLHLVP